jgi:hypothetical protein
LLGSTLGLVVLWNKADIVLEMPTPSTQPSLPRSSPPSDDPDDGDDDDNDGGGKGNDNAASPATSPRDSPPTDKSSARGDTRATPGDVTPPSESGLKNGSNQCPSPPRKPADEEGATPLNHTKTSWEAYQLADKYPYSTEFERFAPFKHSHTL